MSAPGSSHLSLPHPRRVRAKKHLGQHFLTDTDTASRIASALSAGHRNILELGPGTGMLTQFLADRPQVDFRVIEIDKESVFFLKSRFPGLEGRIMEADFLACGLEGIFRGPFALIGNFPYNISSQILFKVLDYKDLIPEIVGMFQKEVAERIAAGPGSKKYGILSVLLQAWFSIEYLFTVNENVFTPQPKVKSAVIRLKRNSVQTLGCDETAFRKVVKTAFNQRRKTLRNSLKTMITDPGVTGTDLFSMRPEQLSVNEFVSLTSLISGS